MRIRDFGLFSACCVLTSALLLSCKSDAPADGGTDASEGTDAADAADSGPDADGSPTDTDGTASDDADGGAPDVAEQSDTPEVESADTAVDDVPEVVVLPPPFEIGEGDHVGVAVVDATPKGFETFTDLNGNHFFDGCRHEPAGLTENCPEPYDDIDGDKDFDAVFIAGFDALRPALEVHDPITVRAMLFARGKEYVVLVAVDVIGLAGDRIERAQLDLGKLGWDPGRIIVTSTHTHQGPDTRGLWGNPFDSSGTWSGAIPAYNQSLTDKIVEAVAAAGAALRPVTLTIGATNMRDRSEWFNGEHFGGKSPTRKLLGLINDGRDPVTVSDQLLAIRAVGEDGKTVATLLNFSGHPELVGDESNALSSDYVHFLREAIEGEFGGTAVFVPECLGGMQSTLGGAIPMTDEKGEWLMEKDAEGLDVPVVSKESGFDYARSAAMHLSAAAIDALAEGEALTLEPFQVAGTPMFVPVDNGAFQVLFQLGLFDVDPALATKDPVDCPGWNGTDLHPGCVPVTVWRVRLGSAEFLTAPGEVLPEIFWGEPVDDPRYVAESGDVGLRGQGEGRDAAYFPGHPVACDATPYDECIDATKSGDCDCTDYHIVPYDTLGTDHPTARTRLSAKYRFLVGNADDHLGYVVPEPDFNRKVSQLTGEDGDHYEETNSVSYRFATMLEEAWDRVISE